MKQAEILQALGLPTTQLFKGYANKLAAMIKLVNELEKMEGFAVSLSGIKGNIELVNSLPVLEMPENYNVRYLYFEKVKQQDNCKEIFGQFEQWDEITVTFKNGSYKFPLPAGNAIYNTFLKWLRYTSLHSPFLKNVVSIQPPPFRAFNRFFFLLCQKG